MAAIDGLIPLIYHEKQQEGSMLCAQHALNSLLQGPYPQFTAPDLSEIARTLDETEHGYLEEGPANPTSTNMDDTGFFSVQVLEEALKVWNLTLVRWRSEEMRPYQDHPHTQMGFILNQSQHWYALRRFGRVSLDPAPAADPGDAHWFNLNSFLRAPERIGKLYLGMFLQQAETEGYSVFAVIQRDPEAPLALPRTEADELAASIPEYAAGGYAAGASTTRGASASAAITAPHPLAGVEGFEDEDMELQAALQASLSGGDYSLPPFSFASVPASSSGSGIPAAAPPAVPPPPEREYVVIEDDDDDDADYVPPRAAPAPAAAEPLDPVAASMARQRATLERMQRAQEVALQEQYEEEVARFQAGGSARAVPPRREEEDEMLQRALAESEAMARAHTPPDAAAGAGAEAESASAAAPPPAWLQHRVYDDEDQELQAALRASLETLPEGFRVLSPPPVSAPPAPRPSASLAPPPPPPIQRQPSSDVETESEADGPEPEPEQPSAEELRRRRLARFGG
ncbi:Josephin-domain-containing protein [Lenzites betulinus]|nr:Josephin-domain-containing protein [Lenzites betulinus]